MGVLRYFPGSEPQDRPVPSEPAGSDGTEPGWAVPVLGPDAAGAGPEPDAMPSRAVRRAENVAMAALTRHDASEAELRAKLAARGLEEDAVEAELARLKAAGLIDDAALADRLVRSLRERKGLGDGALRPALQARHLTKAVIDAALAANAEDDEAVEERLQ